MKYIKKINTIAEYAMYLASLNYSNTPNISLCKYNGNISFTPYKPYIPSFVESSYNLLDILYENNQGDLKVSSEIMPIIAGYTPIGICIAATGFFGTNEPARFMSLKYMNYETPETGSLSPQDLCWGNKSDFMFSNNDISTIVNIYSTHNGGTDYGWLTTSWQTQTYNLVPSVFDTNNEWNISVLGTVNQYAVTDIDGKNKTNKIIAVATSQSDWRTATSVINNSGAGYTPAACCCARYHTIGTNTGDWYFGAAGEMSMVVTLRDEINNKLAQIASIYSTDCISSLANSYYWSSTECDADNAYSIIFYDGSVNPVQKGAASYIIAMLQY